MTGYTDELVTCANELAAAAKSLAADWRHCDLSGHSATGKSPYSTFLPNAPEHVRRAHRTIIINTSRIQVMLSQPADFLQRLALHVRIRIPQPLVKS